METVGIIVGVAVFIALVAWFVYPKWIAIFLDRY